MLQVTAKMPENPAELQDFVRSVVDIRVVELQKETLDELRHLGEGQARLEGRLDELAAVVRLYREDFNILVGRFDNFQIEMRREHEVFRQEMRAEDEKFRQEVWGRFHQVDEWFESIDRRFEKIDERFERIELRLFEMQRSITVQTRWLVALLVAAPMIYSVMDRVLLRLIP